MKKNLTKLLALALAACTCVSVTSCGPKDEDNPQTLDIYLLYKGYQDEWLTSTIDLFKQQDWVKADYPELTINYTQDGTDSTAFSKLSAGESINKYDLLFSVNLSTYDATGVTMDLTDAVYNSEVPGETGVKVKDKVDADRLAKLAAPVAKAPEREDGGSSYYTVNYIDGMYSMLYNANILETLQLEVPVTTTEFKNVCNAIKTGDGYQATIDGVTKTYKTPIINSAGSNYWATTFNVWWAQYEGYDEYCNFYNGTYKEELSNKVVEQTGRLRSLETIESIFRSGYSIDNSSELDYKTAQTSFLSGHGVFHYNGDYFASEMRLAMQALKTKGIDYDIKYMKMPVISSIVEKLEDSDMTDETLASIIREIDNDVAYDDSQAKTNGVSKADFNKIAEARQIAAYGGASAQQAVIPDYSPSKTLAADFLRFMFTDVAISNFAKASGGIRFPAKYEYSDSELADFSKISKSAYEISQGTSNYAFKRLPAESSFELGKVGLTALASFNNKFEVLWHHASTSTTTAKDVYDAEKNHWNTTSWGQLLARAGYAGN